MLEITIVKRMKKIIVVLAALAFSVSSQAQSILGLKAEVGVGQLVTEYTNQPPTVDLNTVLRPITSASLYYRYELFKLLSVETGVNAFQNATVEQVSESGSLTETLKRFTYVGVPLTVNLQFNKLMLGFGVQPSYLINNSLETIQDDLTTTWQGKIDEYENFDLSALMNINYALSKRLGLDIRLQQGLSNISTTPDISMLRNQIASIGISFNIIDKTK